MPITSSAKKALRASERKHFFNLNRKNDLDKTMKTLRKLVEAKDKTGALNLVSKAYQSLDKASKTGYIKPNTASRKKSRIMAMIAKIA